MQACKNGQTNRQAFWQQYFFQSQQEFVPLITHTHTHCLMPLFQGLPR